MLSDDRHDGAEAAELGLSVVVPVYGNEGSIPALLERLAEVQTSIGVPIEVVCVVDGSPDQSQAVLERLLPQQPYASQLLVHSRNFGSFAATSTGFAHARSQFTGVIAADLQEPPELLIGFHEILAADEADVVVGARRSRNDPLRDRLPSQIFWGIYRRLIQPDLPPGGVDVFACNALFRRELLALDESNSSLIGLIYWLGFRRKVVEYDRQERTHGSSGWTFRRKVRYLMDSVFAFTDLPIKMLTIVGAFGVMASALVAVVVASARIAGIIDVPGYAGTIMVVSFFAALNLLAVGLVGQYIWRAFDNTKRRPGAVVMSARRFDRA